MVVWVWWQAECCVVVVWVWRQAEWRMVVVWRQVELCMVVWVR
jgi:hypothetical protein